MGFFIPGINTTTYEACCYYIEQWPHIKGKKKNFDKKLKIRIGDQILGHLSCKKNFKAQVDHFFVSSS